MSTENKVKSIYCERPLLFSFIFTVVYGFVAYFSDLVDLEHLIFSSNLSPFERVFLTFISRFILSGLLWLLFVPMVLHRIRGLTLPDFVNNIRLQPKQDLKRNISIGILASITFALVVVGTAILLGVFTSDFNLLVSPDYENGLGWFIFVFALIPGIWEEIAFRGIIFSLLLSKYSARKSIVLSGLLFSFFHIFNFLILNQDFLSVLLQSVAAFFVGITLAFLVLRKDSILPAIIIHYSIDVTLFISGFIFNLNDDSASSIFAILVLMVIPPIIIYIFTILFTKKKENPTTVLRT